MTMQLVSRMGEDGKAQKVELTDDSQGLTLRVVFDGGKLVMVEMGYAGDKVLDEILTIGMDVPVHTWRKFLRACFGMLNEYEDRPGKPHRDKRDAEGHNGD